MKQKIYAIYDKVAQEGGPLFCAKNDGIAMRHYLHIQKEMDNIDDFKLLCVGDYDSDLMNLDINQVPEEILEKVGVEDE